MMSVSDEGEVSVSSVDEVETNGENENQSQSREACFTQTSLTGRVEKRRKSRGKKARKRQQSRQSKMFNTLNKHESFTSNLHWKPRSSECSLLPSFNQESMHHEEGRFCPAKFSHETQSYHPSEQKNYNKVNGVSHLSLISSDREIVKYEDDLFSSSNYSNEIQSYHPSGQSNEANMDALVAANEGLDIFSTKLSPRRLALKKKRKRLKSLEYFQKKQLRESMMASRKLEGSSLACKYYREGLCNKGDECPFNHNIPQQKKSDVCKYYLSGNCNKRDTCLYMHSDYPCRFHNYGGCRMGMECKFSHAELTPQLQQLLDQQLIPSASPVREFQSTTTTATNESPVLSSAMPLFSKVNLSFKKKDEETKSEERFKFSEPSQSTGQGQSLCKFAEDTLPFRSLSTPNSSSQMPCTFSQLSMGQNNTPPRVVRPGQSEKTKPGLVATPPFPLYPTNEMARPRHSLHGQPSKKSPLLSHIPSSTSHIQSMQSFAHSAIAPPHFSHHRPSRIFQQISFPRPSVPDAKYSSRMQNHATLDSSSSLCESMQTHSDSKEDGSLTTFIEAPNLSPPQQDAYLHLDIPWRLVSLDTTIPDSKVAYSNMKVPSNLHYACKDPRLRANPEYSYVCDQSMKM